MHAVCLVCLIHLSWSPLQYTVKSITYTLTIPCYKTERLYKASDPVLLAYTSVSNTNCFLSHRHVTVQGSSVWESRLPRQHCWGFRSSGTWCCVSWLVFPDISKECSAFDKMSWNPNSAAKCHIPEDLICQKQYELQLRTAALYTYPQLNIISTYTDFLLTLFHEN